MKRTNATNITPPRAKHLMAATLDLDPNTVALADQERQRTLVFIGLPESNAARPSERVQEDREATTKILDHLEVEAEPTAVFRLGQYDPQRTTPRPLKVVLPTPTHQHVALGGWKRDVLDSDLNKTCPAEYEARVRKRQQNPAPMAPATQLPQTNAPTPVVEEGPNQKKTSDDIPKQPEVFDETILVCYEALISLPPTDKIVHQIQSLEKQYPQLFNK
ncbi:hypothetical protein niasHT_016606 [Heterodera trifolii]|uniref:Uncharacterized protein n=1 Tax=Heterodera trifolii TaxID=157864 RepID=A0ABD2LKQ9_9BILA